MRLWIRAIQFDVLVSGVQLFRQVHLDAFVSCHNDAVRAVELEHLGEDQSGGPGTDNERVDADSRVELVHPMYRARGRLDESRFFIREVVDLEQLVRFTDRTL